MSGSLLAGPPREADKGGKRGIEGDFPLRESALFIRSARRVRGILISTPQSPRRVYPEHVEGLAMTLLFYFNPFRRWMECPVFLPFSVFILSSLCST
jgi:hypothetical protein